MEHKRTKRIYAMKVIKKELVNDDEVCRDRLTFLDTFDDQFVYTLICLNTG